MKRRGSIFILFLWVLLLLSLFAMSVGFRTRLAVKIAGYETKRFGMSQDFLTAVNLARFFIDSDEEPTIDFKEDTWYGIPKEFSGMDFAKRFELEISDEESKVDLNKVSPAFLVKFFEVLKRHDIVLKMDPEDLAASIAAWRGMGSMAGKSAVDLSHKPKPFESVEELRLIKGITQKDVEMLRPFFTVYSSRNSMGIRFNLNTVHPYILEALILSLRSIGGETLKRELFERIERVRQTTQGSDQSERAKHLFFRQEDLNQDQFLIKLRYSSGNQGPINLLVGELLGYVTTDSQFFSVRVRSLLPRKESYRMEVVLGDRIFQRFPGASTVGSASGAGKAVTTPLEILSWREGLSS